jgi:hypothetical protein
MPWTKLRKDLSRLGYDPDDVETTLLSYLLTARAVREIDGRTSELRGSQDDFSYRLGMTDESRQVTFHLSIGIRGPPATGLQVLHHTSALIKRFPIIREEVAHAISHAFTHPLKGDPCENDAERKAEMDELWRRATLRGTDPLYPLLEPAPSALREYAPLGPWHVHEHRLAAYLWKTKAPGERLSDVALRLANGLPGEVSLYRGHNF